MTIQNPNDNQELELQDEDIEEATDLGDEDGPDFDGEEEEEESDDDDGADEDADEDFPQGVTAQPIG